MDSSQKVNEALSMLFSSSQSASAPRSGADAGLLSPVESRQSGPSGTLTKMENSPFPIKSSNTAAQDMKPDLISLGARQPSQIVTQKRVMGWYHGIFGQVTIQKISRFTGATLTLSPVHRESISEETIIILRPSFLKKRYALNYVESLGRISRTLNVDCVVEWKHPLLEMCRSGDILGLRGAVEGGRASFDIVDSQGWGMLHVSILLCHLTRRL